MFAAKNIFALVWTLGFLEILFQPVETDSYVGVLLPGGIEELHRIIIKKSLGTW